MLEGLHAWRGEPRVWLVSIRDLQWRRRRFIIGILATAVLFAVTLVLAGLSTNLRAEAERTIAAVGADRWVVVDGTSGPVSGVSVMPLEVVDELAGVPGVDRADPLVMIRQSVRVEGREQEEDVVLMAFALGGLGEPEVTTGRPIQASGEVVIDAWSGLQPGDRVTLGSRQFDIVGTTEQRTITGGISTLYVEIADAHSAVFRDVPLIQAVLLSGTPTGPVDGFVVLTPTEVVDDIMRPLWRLLTSVGLVSWLLWSAAAAVVGSIIFLTAVERTRDFAVMKAVGVGNWTLFGGLAAQAVLVTVVAAALAVVIARLIVPLFPTPLEVTSGAILLMIPVTLSVGLVAALASMRRVMTTDPATAFGSA